MNANVVELDNHVIDEETHVENIQEIKIETIECAFQKMTPIECDDISYYKQALDFVFKEDDLVNIAITGPYSSGKSSVINTYKKISPKNIIHISLAYFNEITSKELSEKEQNSLEGKIINQLIHQIDPKKIPLTRFKIKPDLEEKIAKKTTGLIISLISCLIFLMNFTWWKEMVKMTNRYFNIY